MRALIERQKNIGDGVHATMKDEVTARKSRRLVACGLCSCMYCVLGTACFDVGACISTATKVADSVPHPWAWLGGYMIRLRYRLLHGITAVSTLWPQVFAHRKKE